MDVDTFSALANAATAQAEFRENAAKAQAWQNPTPTANGGRPFAEALETALAAPNPLSNREQLKEPRKAGPSMEDAAKELEIQMVTFMLKTMDESSPGGGILGKSAQGLGYFRDEFFRHTAEQMVENQGLGFAESLKNTYETKELKP